MRLRQQSLTQYGTYRIKAGVGGGLQEQLYQGFCWVARSLDEVPEPVRKEAQRQLARAAESLAPRWAPKPRRMLQPQGPRPRKMKGGGATKPLVAYTLLLSAVTVGSRKTPRIDSPRNDEYLNPDIAMGTQFHVAAKQHDGTKRCYFIEVGNRIEQGPTNKKSNNGCARSYKKEIDLGRYDGTLTPQWAPGDAFMQQYVKGDSVHCGTEHVGKQERRGLVDPSSRLKGRVRQKVRRRTSLVMLRNEDQAGITASVREPRVCHYEVVLVGPQRLLLGGGSTGGTLRETRGGAGNARSVRKDKKSRKTRKNQNSGTTTKKPTVKARVSQPNIAHLFPPPFFLNEKNPFCLCLILFSEHTTLVVQPILPYHN